MLIAFALSVVLVCGLSLLIGRSISKALASMVSAMTRLAGGDVAMAIPGLGRARRDRRNGRRGRGVQEQHDRGRAAARRAAEAEARQARAAQGRHASSSPMQFEGAVGEIVETVSSASTELEASADTLTTDGRALPATRRPRSRRLRKKPPPTCSRWPRPAEELTSSVNEISRQVQESARDGQRGGGPGAEDQ